MNTPIPFKTAAIIYFKFMRLVIIVILGIALINSSYFLTESGYIYHYQNTLTGKIEVYTEPSVHFKTPFFSRVTPYQQVMTVVFSNTEDETITRIRRAITVRFADTYTSNIQASFSYKLPQDINKIKKIHRDFRSFENLVDTLLAETSRDVVVNTATQYSSEKFFQGDLKQFKFALYDQLSHNGLKNPLESYGIEVTQITLSNPIPDAQLEQLLTDKHQKEKELMIAQVERDIQKAKFEAAQFEAKAIREKNIAEAEIQKAKYKNRLYEIY